MEINKEHIRTLLFEKIGGTISEADNEWIESMIREDETVRQLWEEIHQELNTPQGQRFLSNLDEDRSWDILKNNMDASRTRRARIVVLRRWMSVAAVCVASLLVTYYFIIQRKPSTHPDTLATQATQEPEQKLQLKLADGKEIDLAQSGEKTIDAGNVQLATAGNKLTYTLNHEMNNAWATLVVPRAADYKIQLKDGTEVWLNAESNLRFPYAFDGNKREVYLQGEAFFKVAKNEAQPFIVHIRNTTVQVLGTSFNVHAYDSGKVVTSLTEGSVLTKYENLSTKLTPGNQAVFSNGKFVTAPFDEPETLAWMEGVCYFHDTKLSDIAAMVHRWFNVKLVFDDPGLANKTFSGAIHKRKPLELLMSNIALSAGAKAHFSGGEWHLQ